MYRLGMGVGTAESTTSNRKMITKGMNIYNNIIQRIIYEIPRYLSLHTMCFLHHDIRLKRKEQCQFCDKNVNAIFGTLLPKDIINVILKY